MSRRSHRRRSSRDPHDPRRPEEDPRTEEVRDAFDRLIIVEERRQSGRSDRRQDDQSTTRRDTLPEQRRPDDRRGGADSYHSQRPPPHPRLPRRSHTMSEPFSRSGHYEEHQRHRHSSSRDGRREWDKRLEEDLDETRRRTKAIQDTNDTKHKEYKRDKSGPTSPQPKRTEKVFKGFRKLSGKYLDAVLETTSESTRHGRSSSQKKAKSYSDYYNRRSDREQAGGFDWQQDRMGMYGDDDDDVEVVQPSSSRQGIGGSGSVSRREERRYYTESPEPIDRNQRSYTYPSAEPGPSRQYDDEYYGRGDQSRDRYGYARDPATSRRPQRAHSFPSSSSNRGSQPELASDERPAEQGTLYSLEQRLDSLPEDLYGVWIPQMPRYTPKRFAGYIKALLGKNDAEQMHGSDFETRSIYFTTKDVAKRAAYKLSRFEGWEVEYMGRLLGPDSSVGGNELSRRGSGRSGKSGKEKGCEEQKGSEKKGSEEKGDEEKRGRRGERSP